MNTNNLHKYIILTLFIFHLHYVFIVQLILFKQLFFFLHTKHIAIHYI